MARLFYPAILEKEPRSSYGLIFPDFPGLISAGHTPEQALVNAHEALSGHVALMVQQGDPLPNATPVEAMPANIDMVAVSLIAVTVPGKAKRVNVTLDEALLEEIDKVTDNRSRFLSEAARAELARRYAG